MRLHPALDDPLAVLVYKEPVPQSPTLADFQRAAHHALAAVRLELEGEKAVLKPNVTSGQHMKAPESGITTHYGFIWGMAEYLAAHGARRGGIYVLEDPLNTNDDTPRTWEGTGYPEMAAATGAHLRSANTSSVVKRVVPRPLVKPVRRVSRLAVDPGAILINVPKMKTHNLGITTLCMKNQMGVDYVFDRHYCAQAMAEIPHEERCDQLPRNQWMDEGFHNRWQAGLARRLIDIAQVVQPRLCVVEGVVGRDGTGFQRGRNFSLGLVVIGTNMVAVDSVTSYLMGFDPQQVIYLRMASEFGLGCNDLAHLRVYVPEGDDLVLCRDLEPWRAQPRFVVLRGLRGEEDLAMPPVNAARAYTSER
jgi:uncharacterized protein (DUF362 family)